MAKHYRLKFTTAAAADLENIFFYISEELSAPQAANNLTEEIEQQIKRLCSFPYSGSPYIINNKHYRTVVVKNYTVFHTVDEVKQQVVIMRILFGTRKFSNLL